MSFSSTAFSVPRGVYGIYCSSIVQIILLYVKYLYYVNIPVPGKLDMDSRTGWVAGLE